MEAHPTDHRAVQSPRLGRLGTLASVLLAIVALTLPGVADAKLTKAGKKEIRARFDGRLYLRMDAPCATGRHPYGTYKRPLVEVSPDGTNTADTDTVMRSSWWHADSTYWGIRINDPVVLDELDFDADDGEVEIELEGVDVADGNATVLKFVNIYSVDDFDRAFEHTFSPVALQDGHDDWADDVKQAIADRELRDGMTKRQVFYVTGTPESFEKSEEGGKEIETWHLRQDRGMKMGFFKAKMGESTGLPGSIRFEDGVLVGVAQSGSSDEFSLDD